jgi:hypothetical protein
VSNLLEGAGIFRGDLPAPFFFSASSSTRAFNSFVLSPVQVVEKRFDVPNLIYEFVTSLDAVALSPKLRLIRAFSLLSIFRGMQALEAATIELSTWTSNRRALESKMLAS